MENPAGALPRLTFLAISLAALLAFHRLSEAEAFAIHLENVTPVCQSIQQRRRHPFPLEHLAPIAERQVARNQQAPTLVAVGEYLEQQLGTRPAERKIAEFVALCGAQHNATYVELSKMWS